MCVLILATFQLIQLPKCTQAFEQFQESGYSGHTIGVSCYNMTDDNNYCNLHNEKINKLIKCAERCIHSEC